MDYLDIKYDLRTGIHKPYNKVNNIPRYIGILTTLQLSLKKSLSPSQNICHLIHAMIIFLI